MGKGLSDLMDVDIKFSHIVDVFSAHPGPEAVVLFKMLWRLAENPELTVAELTTAVFEFETCKHCDEEIRAERTNRKHYRWHHMDRHNSRGCRTASRTDTPLGRGNEALDPDWKATPKEAAR